MKVLFCPSETLVVATGNHGAHEVAGPEAPANVNKCFHAPLRSKAALRQQAEYAVRLDAGGFDPSQSWHTRRWHCMMQTRDGLDREWAANSWDDKGLLIHRGRVRRLHHPVIADHRLADAVRLRISGAFGAADKAPSSHLAV